jgi:hypothetical protein
VNIFERRRIAQSTVALHVGRLPAHGERAPRIDMPQAKIRALSASWFCRGEIVREGAVYRIDADEASGLLQRKLAELVL